MNQHRFQNFSIVAYTFVLIVLAFLTYQVGVLVQRVATLEATNTTNMAIDSVLARRSFIPVQPVAAPEP